MLHILAAGNFSEVNYFLSKQVNLNYTNFILNSNQNCVWDTWLINNLQDLNDKAFSGFGIFEEADFKSVVLVKPLNSIDLNQVNIEYLSKLSSTFLNREIFIFIPKEDLSAAIKKLLTKNNLSLMESEEINNNLKVEIIKKYFENNYPEEFLKLTPKITTYLQKFSTAEEILSHIDFLILSEMGSWESFVSLQEKPKTDIFKLSFSKNTFYSDIKNIYPEISKADQNQLLITILFMRLNGKKEYNNLIQKLILTDYYSKTVSNATLWLKLWLFNVAKSWLSS